MSGRRKASKRGGRRKGAGRPAGEPTELIRVSTSAAKDLRELAQVRGTSVRAAADDAVTELRRTLESMHANPVSADAVAADLAAATRRK